MPSIHRYNYYTTTNMEYSINRQILMCAHFDYDELAQSDQFVTEYLGDNYIN